MLVLASDPGGSVQRVAPEDVLGMAPSGARSPVTGRPTAAAVHLESEGDLYQREPLCGERQSGNVVTERGQRWAERGQMQ